MADHRARHGASETGVIRAADLIGRFDSGTRPAGHRHALVRPAFALPGQSAGASLTWPVVSMPSLADMLPNLPTAQSRRTIVAAVSAGALGVTAAIAAVTPATTSPAVAPQAADSLLSSAPAAGAAAFTLPGTGEAALDASSAPVTGADLAATVAPAPAAAAVPVPVADPAVGAAAAPTAGQVVTGPDIADAAAAERAATAKAALDKAAAKAAAAKAAASKEKAAAAAAAVAGGEALTEVDSGGSSAGVKALAFARGAIGKPYRYGAAGPGAFDCSGLVMSAFKKAGVSLPRTSAAQSRVGRAVGLSELKPGDLVFFYSPVSHVGIYIGGGKMVHASTSGEPVKISDIGRRPFHNARRL